MIFKNILKIKLKWYLKIKNNQVVSHSLSPQLNSALIICMSSVSNQVICNI